MSPILVNTGTYVPPSPMVKQKKVGKSDVVSSFDPPQDEKKNEVEAREERKATGRTIAIIIFLCLMCLALYHVIQRKTTILAGVSF